MWAAAVRWASPGHPGVEQISLMRSQDHPGGSAVAICAAGGDGPALVREVRFGVYDGWSPRRDSAPGHTGLWCPTTT